MRLLPSIAVLILLGGGLAAHSGTVTNTYLSTVNNVAIGDNNCTDATAAGTGLGGISNQITIPAGDMGTINDVNVQVAMSHTWRGDIQAALTDGTSTVLLANNHGASADNYHATFDTQGAALCSAAANCGGAANCVTPPGPVCQPNQSLDVFNGAEAGGRVFTLRICDRAGGDTGTLINWALAVERTPPATVVTGTYPSTVNNVPILPDNGCVDDAAGTGVGGISNVITIPGGDTGPIVDVDVQVQITHTWRSDLQMALTDGTSTVILANNHDGSGDNYFATFDSQGAALCSAAANCGTAANCVTAPGPICQPNQSLDVFNGAEAGGRAFTLRICDRAGGDVGTLLNWTLIVDRQGAGVVEADLSVTLADAPDPVNAGENLTYTVTATNNGPSDAANVSITLPLPAGTSFVSVNGGAGAACNAASPVTCTWAGPTASGASRVAVIVAAVAPSTTGTLNATATVTSDTNDPNLANNTATAGTAVSVVADLAITKTNGVASSTPGTTTVYTIVASNAGPSNAPGSIVADTFPAACVGVTWTCTGAGGGTCTANGAGNINDTVNLPVGGSVTYSVSCPIDPAAVGTLANTATVSVAAMGVSDPNGANNSATDSDTLTASADLSITKVAVGVPTPVLVGSTFSYQLTVNNAGPSTATAVVVTDVLPPTLDLVSNDCGAVYVDPTLTWTIGTLAPGATVVCNLNVVVATLGPIVNTASLSSATSDPNGANNASTSTLTGAEETDMSISLTSNVVGNLAVGDTFVYTVTGTNNGPGVAFDIDFTLELSSKVSFVSSTCGAVLTGTTLTWTVPTLASGASATCQITVVVVLPGDIQATASVTSITFDPDLSNNSADLVVGTGAIPVPTFGTLGLLLLSLLLGGLGMAAIRR